jgi:hypothetical protein
MFNSKQELTMAKPTQAQIIREYLTVFPEAKITDAAKALGLKYQRVYMVKKNMDKKSKRPTPQKWKTLHISTSDNSIEAVMEKELPVTMHDPVNHPAHYKVGGIETIDFIEAKRLNYNMGNAVKYITRADHKGNRKQDLEKAIWYLNRELDHSL